jgi:hypothetical protein
MARPGIGLETKSTQMKELEANMRRVIVGAVLAVAGSRMVGGPIRHDVETTGHFWGTETVYPTYVGAHSI